VFAVFLAVGAFAQEIQRLSAQFKNFDGTETSTTAQATGTAAVPGTGGFLVYAKSVFVPALSGGQVMYVTISAVGDDHFGESNFLSCNVDGPLGVGTLATVCNPTPTTTGIDLAPPGWVGMTHHFQYNTVLGGPCGAAPGVGCTVTYTSNGVNFLSGGDGGGGQGDEHDNDYYYTWCKPIKPGSHVVNLRLGNKTGNNTVFFEKAFFYIDVSATPPASSGCTKSSL
jgi:hypothetical protein